MKYHIEAPKPASTKTPEEADQMFRAGSIIGYRVTAYTAILTRLDDRKWGFAIISGEGRSTPTFVSTTSAECIRLAAGSNNSGRVLFVVDRLSELEKD